MARRRPGTAEHRRGGGRAGSSSIELLRQLAHELARLFIADREVRHLKTAPACLPLGKRQVARTPNDLAHARVAEQVRVDWCRFANWTMFRGAQGQDAHVGALGRLLDDQPGLAALHRPAGAVGVALAREEQRLVVRDALLLGPQQELASEPELGSWQEDPLDGQVGFFRFGSTKLSRWTSMGRSASTSEMRAPVAHRAR